MSDDAAIISLKLETAKARLAGAEERLNGLAMDHRNAVARVKEIERLYMSASIDVERWKTVVKFLTEDDSEEEKDGAND